MNYLNLLQQVDDPVHWMEPPGFDYETAYDRCMRFVTELSQLLNIELRVESGVLLQDASYHTEVFISSEDGAKPAIRFSSFGDLVTVMKPESLPDGWLDRIVEILNGHGYTYVPLVELKQPYTGTNPGVSGFREWLARYFGC